MKSYSFLFFAMFALLAFSCSDGITDSGLQIQPEGDTIHVDTATVHLTSENIYPEFMYSRPDSFMLGTFIDPVYGTTYADILAQVQPPVDFSFPDNAVADSAKLLMNYYTWFGDKYSPMQVNIYELNKGNVFSNSQAYRSDINVNQYTDKSIKIGGRIFSAKDAVIVRADTNLVEFPLTQSFVQRFSPVLNKNMYIDSKTEESYQQGLAKFFNFFNGIYVTADFGTASMLYIRGLGIKYYYHYTYVTKKVDGVTDSIVTVKNYQLYPVNREVVRVNRIQHPDINAVKQRLNADDQVNHLSSPANVYTRITLPLRKLRSQIKIADNKILLLNRAKLRIDITEINDDDLAQPIATRVLLIKESKLDEFFKKKELPSDTSAILAKYSYETDSVDTDSINYYYSFDMAKLITHEIRNKKISELDENMNFVLVPVTIQYDGSSNVIAVRPSNLMSATKINSGKHKTKPMKIDMVYSGF